MKITTRGTIRTPAALRHTLRVEATLNPDAVDFAVPENAEVREQAVPTLPAAIEAARDLQASRPFGTYLKTMVSGPLGTIRVSPNGRLWGDETPNVEYELRGESLAVVRVRGDAR